MPSSTRTDAQGAARIGRVPGPLPTWLAIESDGHAPSFVRVEASQEHVHVTLEAPASLSVIVRTPDGRPAVGAEVSVELPFPAVRRTVQTDAAGHAAIDGLPHGPFLLVATVAEACAVVQGESTGQVSLGTIHLRRDQTIGGRILDPRARRLSVHLEPTDRPVDPMPAFPRAAGMGAQSVPVRDDGSFQFMPCRRSSYDLVVREQGSNVILAQLADVRPGGPALVLRCSESTGESRVVGQLSGLSKTARLALRAVDEPGLRLPLQWTGRDFRSTAVRPGRYRLMLTEPSTNEEANERAIARLDLHVGLNDLGLVPWPQSGAVLLQGSNLAACSVTLGSPESQQLWHLDASDSPWNLGAESARLSGVPPGTYELRVERGRSIDRRTITVDSDEVTEVRLQLEPERKLRLRVSSERALYPDEGLALDVLGPERRILLSIDAPRDLLTRDRWALWSQRILVPYTASSLRVRSEHGLSGEASLEGAKSTPLGEFAPVEVYLTSER